MSSNCTNIRHVNGFFFVQRRFQCLRIVVRRLNKDISRLQCRPYPQTRGTQPSLKHDTPHAWSLHVRDGGQYCRAEAKQRGSCFKACPMIVAFCPSTHVAPSGYHVVDPADRSADSSEGCIVIIHVHMQAMPLHSARRCGQMGDFGHPLSRPCLSGSRERLKGLCEGAPRPVISKWDVSGSGCSVVTLIPLGFALCVHAAGCDGIQSRCILGIMFFVKGVIIPLLPLRPCVFKRDSA